MGSNSSRIRKTQAQALVLPLTKCVAQSKLLNLTKSCYFCFLGVFFFFYYSTYFIVRRKVNTDKHSGWHIIGAQ